MGYTTQFEGILKFKTNLTDSEEKRLELILDSDVRNLKGVENGINWGEIKKKCDPNSHAIYIQFCLTNSKDGIEWDGSEKFYEAEKCVNIITEFMRLEFPNFCLTGDLLAQGESIGDIWWLTLDETGWATKEDILKQQEDGTYVRNRK